MIYQSLPHANDVSFFLQTFLFVLFGLKFMLTHISWVNSTLFHPVYLSTHGWTLVSALQGYFTNIRFKAESHTNLEVLANFFKISSCP